MAIKGKEKYELYLTPEYVASVRSVLEKTAYKGGLSGYIDGIMKNTHETLVESGAANDKPVTAAKLLRMFLKGITKE